MPFITWYLWIAPNVLCALALVIGLRKKCLKTLPVFFSSLAFQVLQTVVGIALIHSHEAYTWNFLFDVVAGEALGLAVIYELAHKMILSHSSVAELLRPLPLWTTAILLLLATVAGALFHPHWQNQVERAAIILSFSTNLVGIGLLLTLLLVTRIMGVCWRSLPAGVALGLGISATVQLAGLVLVGQPGKSFIGDLIQLGSFHLCVMVWLVYLLLPEKRLRTSDTRMTGLIAHSQELQTLVRR